MLNFGDLHFVDVEYDTTAKNLPKFLLYSFRKRNVTPNTTYLFNERAYRTSPLEQFPRPRSPFQKSSNEPTFERGKLDISNGCNVIQTAVNENNGSSFYLTGKYNHPVT